MEPMSIDLLSRLQTPDEQSLAFNPYGLGSRLTPDAATQFQASVIGSARLAADVPEGIRDYWERVRLLYLHGVLEYEFFSAAGDLGLLALEGALRARFVDYFSGQIPVARRTGSAKGIPEVLHVQRFEQVWDAARHWDLLVPGDNQCRLPTSLAALLAWARRMKLLPGRRSRGIDGSLVKLRNWAAHPEDYTLDIPPSVASTLRQVAEYINMLWGHPSPEGQTFKTTLRRSIRVVGIAPHGDRSIQLRLHQVDALAREFRDYRFAVFLAADDEPRLTSPAPGPGPGIQLIDKPGFQETQFPCERVFEGDWDSLREAIRAGAFESLDDEVEWLERLFIVRRSEAGVDPARSPEDLDLLDAEPPGAWWVVVADAPWDAVVHVREHLEVELESDGTCPRCFVEVRGTALDRRSARLLCAGSALL